MTALRVVVTGGSGFLGSHLADRLATAGHHVTVFDRVPSPYASPTSRLRFVVGDIRDRDQVAQAISPGTSTVFHFSAIVGVARYLEDPSAVIDVNIGGTRNVLEAAASSGSKVVLASTSEIYGKNPRIPWAESDDRVLGSTAADRWSYSTSKAVCEHLAFAAHRAARVPVVVLRFFNVYGPRQRPNFVVAQSVRRVLRGERPLLYDQGVSTRCFTYIDDAIEAVIQAAEAPGAIGEVFNVGSDREVSARQVVEAILAAAGSSIGWEELDTRARFGSSYEDIMRRVPDVTKIRRVLGWSATTSLEAGVKRTIEWARQNRWWLS